MKGKLISAVAGMVGRTAQVSAKSLCVAIYHQPKVPARLLNK